MWAEIHEVIPMTEEWCMAPAEGVNGHFKPKFRADKINRRQLRQE
jgi:hypothetical protein